jgi:5'-3' exonuclease
MVIGYLKKIGITLNDKIICAEDYSSWRKEICKEYKAQRKEFRESKMEASKWAEFYEKFNELMPKLDKCLPWYFIKIYKMEADDIVSCAVRFIDAEEKIIISSDEDWQMLCSIPNVKLFSPYKKKFIEVKNPEKILLKKIKGDVSDNLLTVPKTEAEWEKRKMIVDLINLPIHIDNIIRPIIETLPIKNLYINKIPFRSCREEIIKLYKLEK